MAKPLLSLVVVTTAAVLAACALTTSLEGLSDGTRDDAGASDAGTPDAGVVEDASPSPDAADAGTSYEAVVMSDGPVGYWRLGEASGSLAKDVTGAHDGIYFGAKSLGAPGAIAGDTAVVLDGTTAGVDVGTVFPFAGNTPYTLEAWVKPSKQGADQRIISHRASDGVDGYRLMVTSTNVSLSERVVNGANVGSATGPVVSTTEWTHLITTYDGATLRIFVNGTLAGSAPATTPLASISVPFVIGTASYKGADWFTGGIDEVAVYDKALGVDRVAAHFRASGR